MVGLVLKKGHQRTHVTLRLGIYIYIYIIAVGSIVSIMRGPMCLSPPKNVHLLLVEISRWRVLREISEAYDIGMTTATPLL